MAKSYRKILHWLFALFLISIACYSFAGNETDLQLTLTASSRETNEEQTNIIVEETSTPSRSWAGSWTTWILFEKPYLVTMTLLQTDQGISGTATAIDGTVANLMGIILSPDLSLASGEWTDILDSGSFRWRQINSDQFIGYYTSDTEGGLRLPWCGARNGASQPDPCLGP